MSVVNNLNDVSDALAKCRDFIECCRLASLSNEVGREIGAPLAAVLDAADEHAEYAKDLLADVVKQLSDAEH